MMPRRVSVAAVLRLVLLAALWGASFMLFRLIVPVFGPLPTAAWRVATGAAVLLAALALMRAPLRGGRRTVPMLALGVLNSALPFLLYAWAARQLPSAYSAILNSMTPLMTLLIGALAFGQRLDRLKMVAVGFGIAGVTVLSGASPLPMTAPVLAAFGACLTATCCYALAAHLAQRLLNGPDAARDPPPDSRTMAMYSQFGATLLLLPLAVLLAPLTGTPPWPAQPPGWPVLAALLALGALCTALAYLLYFRLLADVGAVGSSLVTFLIPPFGVLWGWLLLGEPVTAAHVAGGLLIGIALLVTMRQAVNVHRLAAMRQR